MQAGISRVRTSDILCAVNGEGLRPSGSRAIPNDGKILSLNQDSHPPKHFPG